MYKCFCMQISADDWAAAVKEYGSEEAAREALGVGTVCGSCS